MLLRYWIKSFVLNTEATFQKTALWKSSGHGLLTILVALKAEAFTTTIDDPIEFCFTEKF